MGDLEYLPPWAGQRLGRPAVPSAPNGTAPARTIPAPGAAADRRPDGAPPTALGSGRPIALPGRDGARVPSRLNLLLIVAVLSIAAGVAAAFMLDRWVLG
jgi:hypothetical protein